jgi:damage-control phosphatase, subfamily I
MKIKYDYLPCLINQVVKVADMTNADHRELLFKKVFSMLGEINFTETNPEIIGMTFRLLKEHIGNSDPYFEIRTYYNKLFLDQIDIFEQRINDASNTF